MHMVDTTHTKDRCYTVTLADAKDRMAVCPARYESPINTQVSRALLEPEPADASSDWSLGVGKDGSRRDPDAEAAAGALGPGGHLSIRPTESSSESVSRLAVPEYGLQSAARQGIAVVDSASAEQRTRYFLRRVMKCQIWRAGGGELFSRLKEVAGDLMDRIADRCRARWEWLALTSIRF